MIKGYFLSALAIAGGAIVNLFGGWTPLMTTLCIMMIIDYMTGLIVAGVFKASPKSACGGLESKAGFRGLARKGVMLVIVLVSVRLDLALETTFIQTAVAFGFCANELISIIENAGLMGIPIPQVIKTAIDLLQSKGETKP